MQNNNSLYQKELILVIATQNPELNILYKNAIEKFYLKKNTNAYQKYPDSGFDLFIPDKHDFSEYVHKDNTIILGHKLDHQVQCCVYESIKNINIGHNIQERKKFLGYYMYPRSSISKTPLRLANCVGIIDSGYRGNLIAKVDNFDYLNNNINNEKYVIQKHSRLFQICSGDLRPFDHIKLIDNFDDIQESHRGTGGFGSTGI